MKQPLTALITCCNEQHNIQACIESVKPIADEILIADSLSDDATLEIIHAVGGCRVVQREFINAGDFKNWAIPQASHSWILLIDSDERVTPALRDEVVRKLASNPDRQGYWIRRANHFLGHPIRHTSWGRDRVIRLFQRDHGRYRLHTDHTEIELPEDQTGQLKERLIHYTCWDFDAYLRKLHRYADQQAVLWTQQGRKPSRLKLVVNGPLRFLRDYVFHRGFLDGVPGFIVSGLTGYYSFLKQARLWQKHHELRQESLEPLGELTVRTIRRHRDARKVA